MTGNIDMQLLDIVTLRKGLPDHVMACHFCAFKLQLIKCYFAYACPYQNQVHNINISKLITHMTPYTWSADAKFSKTAEAAYW